MKYTLISTLLFILLLGFIGFMDYNFEKLCTTVTEQSNTIESQINTNDWVAAYESSLTLLKKIEDKKTLSSIYINHTDFDALNNEALRLSSYIESMNSSDSKASVTVLKSTTENIKNINKLNLKNIL